MSPHSLLGEYVAQMRFGRGGCAADYALNSRRYSCRAESATVVCHSNVLFMRQVKEARESEW